MFGLGPSEMVVIVVAALLVFGPKRLPELAKGLGKGIRDFKKALEDRTDDEKTEPEKLTPAQTPHTIAREKTAPREEATSS